jgi:hypothetical protein
MSPFGGALRDLERYYALLEAARRRLRGRFSLPELEALAYALQGTALIEVAELLYLAPAAVEDSARYEDLCGMAGIEDCQGFWRGRRASSWRRSGRWWTRSGGTCLSLAKSGERRAGRGLGSFEGRRGRGERRCERTG